VRRRGGLALAALALAAPAGALRGQDEGLFELRLTAVAESRTVAVLLDARGEPLLPLGAALEFLEIPLGADADGLTLEWPPEIWSTRLVLATREVTAGGTSFTAASDEWLPRGSELFVSPAVLERVLGGQVRVDWENLGVIVAGRDDYPLVRRLRNQERRRATSRERVPGDEEASVPYPARSGGATLGWGISAVRSGGASTVAARAAGGAAILGGGIEIGAHVRGDGGTARLTNPSGRYTRSFPVARHVRQLELGDVRGEGLLVRPVFGFSISNEPLYAPRYFGEAMVRPVLPAGWEYEVYEGDHLIGVSARGSHEPVATPIGYGTTPIRVRMIGPAGQERVEELVFLVPAVQVPAGQLRYGLAGGACRSSACGRAGSGVLRYGVTRSLTTGVGVEHTADDSASVTRPFATVTLLPAPGLRTELRLRPGALMHGTLQRHARLGGWRVAGGWTHEEGGHRLQAPAWFGEAAATMATGLPGRGRTLTLVGRGRRSTDSLQVDRWQVTGLSGFRSVGLGIGYERGHQLRDVLSLTATTPVPRRLVPSLRNPQASLRLDLAASEVVGASLGNGFRVGDRVSVHSALTWFAGGGPPGVSVSVVTRTPAAYVQTSTHAGRGDLGGHLTASGGLAFGYTTTLVTSPFETIGRGGVTGVVFHDTDGDGAWGPHEEPARGVPVIVGGERAITDQRGVFRAWGLLPYRVISVAVDTLNLAATNLSAGRPEDLIRPTPNLYARQDLPLLRTREALGQLRWEGARGGLGGVSMEAVAVDGSTHRVATFSDGEYYFPRLPAGAFTVRVAESSLRALGATASTAQLVVPAAGDGPVRAPPITLRRSP
jgi:hypothetical protein